MSNVHKLEYLQEKIQELKDSGTYRELDTLQGANESVIMLDGKEVINMSSNNYLGLSTNEAMKEAAKDAIDAYGVGSGAVRTIIGNMDIHEKLEEKLAEFKREEAVMVFQSGFNCNAGAIQAITDRGDLIVSDELNHASIIDGVRLSRADKALFKHSDMKDLKRVLEEKREDYNNCLIITDGVFSMDGDLAPVPEIVDLATKYNALVMIDDAHGTGVVGPKGKGVVDYFDLVEEVDIQGGCRCFCSTTKIIV